MVVDYTIGANETVQLIFYDIAGKRIATYSLNGDTDRLQISENNLNNGVYFYTVILNNKVLKHDKIVVIK
jgi:hypothetical protein